MLRKMMTRPLTKISLTLLVTLLSITSVLANSGTPSIDRYAIAGGGHDFNSSSSGYALNGTFGQSVSTDMQGLNRFTLIAGIGSEIESGATGQASTQIFLPFVNQ